MNETRGHLVFFAASRFSFVTTPGNLPRMLGIGDYLWRLLPANPILLRVIAVAGKRTRDLVVRCLYLGLLIVIVIAVIAGGSGTSGSSLTQLSVTSTNIFERLSYLQLGLVAMLAPIFTAGAITQEKDSQTYDILLSTPLTNGQIVLGSLFSRLFFVLALLISGIPIFSITQIFGGVAFSDVILSCAIAGVTALVTGALAIAIATFKVGTRRTIFSFYLFNAIYLVGGFLADSIPQLKIPLIDAGGMPAGASGLSWLTGLHPFLALRVVLDPIHYPPPTLAQLPETLRWWPASWLATSPVSFYLTLQAALSLLLVVPSIVLLRRLAQSTNTIQSQLAKLNPLKRGTAARKPRTVWSNPIAWREGVTKASAARSTVLRYGFILLGMIGAIILVIGHAREAETPTRWVDRGSYNPTAGTLTILGDQVYGVADNLVVRMNGNVATSDLLNKRHAIASNPLITTIGRGANATKVITQVDIRAIERQIKPATARRFLLGLVLVEVCAILLIITNAAASTVTREKEDGTLDLLLSTPITSYYYIWGKVRGLVSYVLPLLAVPVASCALFVIGDFIRLLNGSGEPWIVLPESILVLPPMLIVVAAFASLVGMNMSLRLRTTVWAVMSSVGIVLGVCGALGWCGWALLGSNVNGVTAAISAFSPFTVLMIMITPDEFGTDLSGVRRAVVGGFARGTVDQEVRFIASVFAIIATCVYAGVVWTMYKSMVKNFDMTIRKQSR
jgi:ABC-type transport system involved in multi-copper enzyme maturation permease subunit